MSEPEIPFLARAAIVEDLSRRHAPTDDSETLEVVLDMIRSRRDLRTYFFRANPHISWAKVLQDHGISDLPPEPRLTNEEYLVLPPWDVQEYLMRRLPESVEAFAQHFVGLDMHRNYRSRGIDGVLALPSAFGALCVERVLCWLAEDAPDRRVVESAARLSISLLRGGETSAGLALVDALTKPLPGVKPREFLGVRLNGEARSCFGEGWEARNFLQECTDAIPIGERGAFARILEHHLFAALELEGRDVTGSDVFGLEALEFVGSQEDRRYLDQLAGTLRRVLEGHVRDDDDSRSLVKEYLDSDNVLPRRFGLHLLRAASDRYLPEIRVELTRVANFNDVKIHHEFFRLLRDTFGLLDSETRHNIVEIILTGPEMPGDRRESAASNEDGSDVVADQDQGYRERWILRRLWVIRQHLPGAAGSELGRLLKSQGEPRHPPEELAWSSGGFFVAEASPLDQGQLAELTVDEVVALASFWEPDPEGSMGPFRRSRSGLASEIAAIAVDRVEEFEPVILELARIGGEFASSLLDVLSPSRNEDHFELFVDLASALLADESLRTSMDLTAEVPWVSARMKIAREIGTLLTERWETISYAALLRVRDLLLILVDDPDPQLEEAGGSDEADLMDRPETEAINHVRPTALDALIVCGYLLSERPVEPRAGAVALEGRRFDEVTRAALSRLLDATDHSLAAHSVFGKRLLWLIEADSEWLNTNLNRILPKEDDQGSLARFVAAWDSFVIFNQPRRQAFELLRTQYERAIDNLAVGRISKSHLEPERRLANHLLVEYFDAGDALPESAFPSDLLSVFYASVGPDHLALIPSMLWRICKNEENNTAELWPRIRSLWEWRSARASELGFPAQFRSEMEHFAQLLEVAERYESFEQLRERLTCLAKYVDPTGRRNMHWDALERYLARAAATDPVGVVEIYAEMYRVASENSQVPLSWSGAGREILETAAADKSARGKALSLIDFIASLGDDRYRDIYRLHAG